MLLSRERLTVESVKHARAACVRAPITERKIRAPKKKKPGGGNAGSDVFVIGVYGFKYAAWLVLATPEGAERLLLLSSRFFFLFFYFLVLL